MSLLEARPVVLITGVPAAGKSTVADLLARRFERGVHVRGDIYRRMVVAGRHEMTASPTKESWRQLRLRYRLGAETANTYHDAGFSVVVQDVVIGDVLLDYIEVIRARPLIVVVLVPRIEVVGAREDHRDKTAYRASFDGIAKLDAALRNETPRLGMWLDTSDQTPQETVDEIVARGPEDGIVV